MVQGLSRKARRHPDVGRRAQAQDGGSGGDIRLVVPAPGPESATPTCTLSGPMPRASALRRPSASIDALMSQTVTAGSCWDGPAAAPPAALPPAAGGSPAAAGAAAAPPAAKLPPPWALPALPYCAVRMASSTRNATSPVPPARCSGRGVAARRFGQRSLPPRLQKHGTQHTACTRPSDVTCC